MASKEDIIKLVVSQTNYTDEEAEEQLLKHDFNYVAVVKEYLNPNFAEKKQEKQKRSLNEKMMDEIRGFMDTATKQYMIRKEKQERMELIKKQMYAKMLEQKQTELESNDSKPEIIEENSDNITNPTNPDNTNITG